MRTFVIVKDGIARVMRTYALDVKTGRVLDGASGAPDAINEVEKWHPDDQAQVTSIREINEEEIPSQHSVVLRDAWEDDGKAIIINMKKARIGMINSIRPERNKRLAALDIDYIRADEVGNSIEKALISEIKQKLRDLPTTIKLNLDAIKEPEVLEAWEPDWPS